MSTIHLHQTTTSTPEQYIAGLTDFGPGRSKLFGNSADEYLKVHDRGPTQADVTEGSGGIWERLHYDWSAAFYACSWITIVVVMSLEEAREHLDLAKEQWESATTAAWEPEDAAGCVTNAFYAYENLIVAVAEAHDRRWEPNHFKKSKLAGELFAEKILTIDVSETILTMNNLRKDVSYGEPGFELASASLEDIVSDLETFCNEVEFIVSALEQKADGDGDDEGEDAEEEVLE
jgi:hypothetical protein